MKIYFREFGGVRATDLKISVEETKWSREAIHSGRAPEKISGVLTEEETERLQASVQKLLAIKPKRSYGWFQYQSDPVKIDLEITIGSEKLEIKTISDPSDPRPQEFYDFAGLLLSMTSP